MLSNLKAYLQPGDPAETQLTRLTRRRKGFQALERFLPSLRIVLFVVGYGWMLLFPSTHLGRSTYIDENALQPGQVKTYWSWDDVKAADRYLGLLEEELINQNATSTDKAVFIKNEFEKMGLPSATQSYRFATSTGPSIGNNAYSILASPRTSGTEALVISASWVSRTNEGEGTPNLRGVATVLALAAFTKKYSHWAKDLVFVINDDYLDGMHAWLNAYHGFTQYNLDAQPLELTSGVIWTALCIDYPGHSFSHLGLFFEGLNGRLPNQDLVNSAHLIARHVGSIPVLLYDHMDNYRPDYHLEWAPTIIKNIVNHVDVKHYQWRAANVLQHIRYQTQGKASGTHGLFHKFRIDAITLFAVPAQGPHGFHSLGRTIESTLRTMNNLLERLHASLFFYLFTSPSSFLKIGHYLPTSIIISLAISFGGLALWVWTGWEQVIEYDEKGMRGAPRWKRRYRPVLVAMAIVIWTFVLGGLLYGLVISSWFSQHLKAKTPLLPLLASSSPIVFSLIVIGFTPRSTPNSTAPISFLLKSFNLCLTGMIIAITSVINFSLAATLSVLLGIPLSLSSPSPNILNSFGGFLTLVCLLSPVGLALGMSRWIGSDTVTHWVLVAIRDWEILGIWFVPFVCCVYTPLVLQSALVCVLPP